jgi:hypothetical protein
MTGVSHDAVSGSDRATKAPKIEFPVMRINALFLANEFPVTTNQFPVPRAGNFRRTISQTAEFADVFETVLEAARPIFEKIPC